MSDIAYHEFFPEEGWICPYCSGNECDEKDAVVSRSDIPSHLVFKHEWNPEGGMTWEYIYNRLNAVGGV